MSDPKGITGVFTHPQRSRIVEDIGFAVGLLLGIAYVGLVEILPAACHAIGRCVNAPGDNPFPWVVVTIIALCVAPKTLGRATAGEFWKAIANRLGGKP